MTEIGWATLGIIPSFKGFESKLDQGTSKAMLTAGANGGAKFGDAAGRAAGGKFKSHMKSAAKVAAAGFAIGAAAAFKFGGDALEEAREAQKVGKLTDAVIKSTGRSARVSAKHVGALSGRLSDMAGVDDELIQSGANVLLTFTKIRNEAGEGNKVFDRAALSALNMSAALGTDLKGSSIQLGKALNDPIKGVSALGRAGVQFSEDQKKAIKGMVDSGNTLGAQKVILRELDTQFKGSARSQATEADKLGVAYGNLKEDVGTALLPVMDDLAVFLRKKGIPALREAGDWVTDKGIPAMKDFGDEIKPVVGHAKDLAGFLNDLPKPAKIAGITAMFAAAAGMKLRGGPGGALGTVGTTLGLAKAVKTFETNPAALGAGGGTASSKGVLGMAGKAFWPVAITVTATAGLKSLLDFHREDDSKNGLSYLGGGGINDWFDKKFGDPQAEGLERAAAAYRGINDATKKLPNQLDQGKTAAQNLFGEIFKIGKADPKVNYAAPGFEELLARTRKYGSILDGLDNRTVTTIMETRYVKNDTGAGGGSNPQPPGRSGGNASGVHFYGGITVQANTYEEIMQKVQRRARSVAGGGVAF